MEKQKRIWLNIVIVFVILLSLITIVGSMNDIQEVIALMGSIHLGYFSVAVLFSLVSFFIMSFSSQTVLTALTKKVPYYTGFLIQVVEPFFNGITPFSSGAQPFQLYYYHKHQVEANQSTSVLVVNFILFQIISVLLATIGILIFFNDIIRALGSYTIYLFIGYSINLIILIGLFLLAYVKSVYRLFEKMFAFFERFKWTKKRATILKNKTFNFVEKVQVGDRK